MKVTFSKYPTMHPIEIHRDDEVICLAVDQAKELSRELRNAIDAAELHEIRQRQKERAK